MTASATAATSAPTGQDAATATPATPTSPAEGDGGGTTTSEASSSLVDGMATEGQDGGTAAPAGDKPEAATSLADGFGTEKPTLEAPAATPAQGAIEITLPAGVEVADPAAFEAFRGLATELKLSTEQASKLASWEIERSQAAEAAQAKEWVKAAQATTQEWEAELKADPEIGGAKYQDSLNTAKKGFRKYGGEEVAKLLIQLSGGQEAWKRGEAYDLTRHPAFFRMFHALGKAMGEDTASDVSGGKPAEPSAEERLKQIYNHPTSDLARSRLKSG